MICLDLLGDAGLLGGEDRPGLAAADDLAHGALGHRLDRAFGVLEVEHVVVGTRGSIRQMTSKSMSMMFSSPVSIRLSSATSRARPCAPPAVADLGAVQAVTFGLITGPIGYGKL